MSKVEIYAQSKTRFRYSFFVIFIIITLPGFLSTFNFATSHRNGLLISLLFIFLFMFRKSVDVNKKFISYLIILVFFILLTTISNIFFLNYQIDTLNISIIRFIGSILILIFTIICAIFLENYLNFLDENHFSKLILGLYNFLIFLGFIVFPFFYFGMLWKKHLFFFSEPSHYSLTLAPFYFYKLLNY